MYMALNQYDLALTSNHGPNNYLLILGNICKLKKNLKWHRLTFSQLSEFEHDGTSNALKLLKTKFSKCSKILKILIIHRKM